MTRSRYFPFSSPDPNEGEVPAPGTYRYIENGQPLPAFLQAMRPTSPPSFDVDQPPDILFTTPLSVPVQPQSPPRPDHPKEQHGLPTFLPDSEYGPLQTPAVSTASHLSSIVFSRQRMAGHGWSQSTTDARNDVDHEAMGVSNNSGYPQPLIQPTQGQTLSTNAPQITWESLTLAMKYHIFQNVQQVFNDSAAYVLGLSSQEEAQVLDMIETRKKQPMTCDQLWNFCLAQNRQGDLHVQPEVFERHLDLMIFLSHFDFALPLEIDMATRFLRHNRIDPAFLGKWVPDPVGGDYLKYVPEELEMPQKPKRQKVSFDPDWWSEVEDEEPLFPDVELDYEVVDNTQNQSLNIRASRNRPNRRTVARKLQRGEYCEPPCKKLNTDLLFGFPGISQEPPAGASMHDHVADGSAMDLYNPMPQRKKRGRPRKNPLPGRPRLASPILAARNWLAITRGESDRERAQSLESAGTRLGSVGHDFTHPSDDTRLAGVMELRGRRSLRETEAITVFRQDSRPDRRYQNPAISAVMGNTIDPQVLHIFPTTSTTIPTSLQVPNSAVTPVSGGRSRHLVLKINDKTGLARIENQYPTNEVSIRPVPSTPAAAATPTAVETTETEVSPGETMQDEDTDPPSANKPESRRHYSHRSHVTPYLSPVIRSIYCPFDEKNRIREQHVARMNFTDLFLMYGANIWIMKLQHTLCQKVPDFKITKPRILDMPDDLCNFSAGLIELWNQWYRENTEMHKDVRLLINFREVMLLGAQWVYFSGEVAKGDVDVKKLARMRHKAEECHGKLVLMGLRPVEIVAWRDVGSGSGE